MANFCILETFFVALKKKIEENTYEESILIILDSIIYGFGRM